MDATPKPLSAWLESYNRSDVARRLGVDVGTVSRWYRGKTIPRGDQLQALARLLGVDANLIIIDRVVA